MLLLLCACPAAATPTLFADTEVAREGYFVLHWTPQSTATADLTLQQSLSPDFRDPESWAVAGAGQFTQSGLDNGVYYFRLRDTEGDSNTVSVEVQHHSLGRALFFFLTGLFLFLVLLGVIVVGQRRTRTGQAS